MIKRRPNETEWLSISIWGQERQRGDHFDKLPRSFAKMGQRKDPTDCRYAH